MINFNYVLDCLKVEGAFHRAIFSTYALAVENGFSRIHFFYRIVTGAPISQAQKMHTYFAKPVGIVLPDEHTHVPVL